MVLGILIAVAASYVAGSLWYLALGAQWRSAVGWTETTPPYRPTPLELVIALIGQVVLALGLSFISRWVGIRGAFGGAHIGAFAWFMFVMPSLATNVVFQRRNPRLIWQDGLHWLIILAVQGAIIGALR